MFLEPLHLGPVLVVIVNLDVGRIVTQHNTIDDGITIRVERNPVSFPEVLFSVVVVALDEMYLPVELFKDKDDLGLATLPRCKYKVPKVVNGIVFGHNLVPPSYQLVVHLFCPGGSYLIGDELPINDISRTKPRTVGVNKNVRMRYVAVTHGKDFQRDNLSTISMNSS